MKDFYSEKVALSLVEMGFDYVEDKRGDEYTKQLELLEREAMAQVVMLNQYYKEYENMSQGAAESSRTFMDFEKDIAVLRKLGYKIGNKTTVFEYCAVVNAFIDENKKRK